MRETPCPDGSTIQHRPETVLRAVRDCPRGHKAPLYRGGICVVCARQHVLASRSGEAAARPSRLRRFRVYARARAMHEDVGGYLLDLGGGVYGVTDDWREVRRLRGSAWVDYCEEVECWDEVEIAWQTERSGAPRIAHGTQPASFASSQASL